MKADEFKDSEVDFKNADEILTENMVSKKFGRILHISSIGVKYGGGENTFNYSFSKHSLEFISSYIKPGIRIHFRHRIKLQSVFLN